MSWFLNRNFELLEPYEGKLSRTVLRGESGSNPTDLPDKPSELEQRDGRGARQGNWIAKMFFGNKVRNYIYAVEQSLDNYKFNLLKNKQTFISQMKNCELNVRTIDEGAIDEKSGMNFSEYIAILSGDTSLLEKSKLEKKVAVMESLKKAHFKEVSRSKYHLDNVKTEKADTELLVAKLTADRDIYKGRLDYDKEGAKANPIALKALDSADPETIGKYLVHLNKTWKPGDEPKIGSLYGFDLFIRNHVEYEYENGRQFERRYNTYYAERENSGIKYTYGQGLPNMDNPKLAAKHFLFAIDKVESLLDKYTKMLADCNKEIPMVEQLIARPFEKETELAGMKTQLANLEREITLKIKENQLKESGQGSLELKPEKAETESAGNTMIIRLQPKVVPAPAFQDAHILPHQPVVRLRKSKGFKM